MDNVGYQLLQHLPLNSKVALLELYNNIWNSGDFPHQWKKGLVIPIAKPNGDHSKPKGYRPITLLSCTGKVFERMINRRLITELESAGRLDHRQYAFRAGKGVDTHIAHLESLLSTQDNTHVEIVSLDISRAYDTTWRPAIIRTLIKWKITGRMLNIITSFLQDRSFQVAANGMLSGVKVAENGVAQGSILSVTLFLTAVQPIFEKVSPEVQTLLYADDVILVSRGSSPTRVRQLLRKAVTAVADWTASVGFRIAPTKSKIIHICESNHRKRGRAIMIDRVPIPRVRKIQILGVLIDSKLNFLQHFASVKKSCASRLNIIRVLGKRVKRSHRETLLKAGSALITSKLLFGLGLTSSSLDNMERVLGPTYNTMIRLASGSFCTSPTQSVVVEAGQLPFRLKVIQRLSQLSARLVEKDKNTNNLPVVKRAATLFQETAGWRIPDVCSIERITDRKWYSKAPCTEDTLERSTQAGTSKEIAMPKFKQLLADRFSNHNHIYTDGSKDGEEVGVGVVHGNTSISMSLPGSCSIFSAEAYALKTAVETIISQEKTIIFTDSVSCIKALRHGQSKHPWIQKTEILAESKEVTFCWIPGHAGIAGNEKADIMANRGRKKIALQIPIPLQDAKRAIERGIWDAWAREWHRDSTQLRRIKPNPRKSNDRKSASEQRMLTRIRIGHTRLTHSYLLDKSTPPICTQCGVQTTIEHILTDCRKYNYERAVCGIKGSLESILANVDEKENNVIDFLSMTKLTEEI